ncbi:MAG: alpha/beta fold hydrolase [Bulleidia sp.]
MIYDKIRGRFSSLSEVPDTSGQWGNWIAFGRIYAEDVWNYDPYEHIGAYDGLVLILHGKRDGLAGLSCSERAAEIYSNAEFHVIGNGAHWFHGQPFEDAAGWIEEFLTEHLPLN